MSGVERKLGLSLMPASGVRTEGLTAGRRHATLSVLTLSFVIWSSGEYFVAPLSPA